MASRSIIPLSSIYEKIQNNGIKVAIDGQGADELLAGYKHYHLAILPLYIKKFKFKLCYDLIKDFFEEGFIKNCMIFLRIRMPDYMKYIGRVLIGYEKYLIFSFKKNSATKNFLNCYKFNDRHQDP